MGKHPIRCRFMCPLRIALTLGQVAHATSGRTLRGRRGLWPFWAKRPKFTLKWSLEKSYLRITRDMSLGLLHGCKSKLCFPFAPRVGVQSIMEAFSTPQSLMHTNYGKRTRRTSPCGTSAASWRTRGVVPSTRCAPPRGASPTTPTLSSRQSWTASRRNTGTPSPTSTPIPEAPSASMCPGSSTGNSGAPSNTTPSASQKCNAPWTA